MSKGFDLGAIFRQAQQLQEKLASVQEEIAGQKAQASAGGGMVTAVVSGKIELVELRIDPSLLETPDVEMLQDLIVAAVNDAGRKVDEQLAQSMGGLMGGLKIPGL